MTTQNEHYEDDLFVGRAEELRRLLAWVQEGRAKLISVIGPPGIGKSWFLRRARQELEKMEVEVFFWDVAPISSQGVLDAALTAWLQEQSDRYGISLGVGGVVAQVGDFSQKMEERDLHPLWIVDGLDALSKHLFALLAEALGAWVSRANTRACVIAAHRQEQKFGYPLSWAQEVLLLKPFSRQTGEKQLQKRHVRGYGAPPHEVIAAVERVVPGYPWSHPRLNAFFSASPPQNREALRAILEKSVLPLRLEEKHWEILLALAGKEASKEDEGFTREDVRKLTGRDVGHPAVQDLYAHELLLFDKQTYTSVVAPGYWECFRALARP